jgi:hypothetical protein
MMALIALSVLDPLKYIVFCGLRNHDELGGKPVCITFYHTTELFPRS